MLLVVPQNFNSLLHLAFQWRLNPHPATLLTLKKVQLVLEESERERARRGSSGGRGLWWRAKEVEVLGAASGEYASAAAGRDALREVQRATIQMLLRAAPQLLPLLNNMDNSKCALPKVRDQVGAA